MANGCSHRACATSRPQSHCHQTHNIIIVGVYLRDSDRRGLSRVVGCELRKLRYSRFYEKSYKRTPGGHYYIGLPVLLGHWPFKTLQNKKPGKISHFVVMSQVESCARFGANMGAAQQEDCRSEVVAFNFT